MELAGGDRNATERKAIEHGSVAGAWGGGCQRAGGRRAGVAGAWRPRAGRAARAPAARKEKASDKGDIKKSSYYVWFLGAKESKGLRGEEFINPVVRHLVGRRRSSPPSR